MVNFPKTQDLSSDNFSCSSTSISFEMEVLLETPYVGGVYFPTLLVVLHLGEEEEGNTATSFDPPPSTGTSQRRRRLIGEEDEQKELKEGLTMSHPLR